MRRSTPQTEAHRRGRAAIAGLAHAAIPRRDVYAVCLCVRAADGPRSLSSHLRRYRVPGAFRRLRAHRSPPDFVPLHRQRSRINGRAPVAYGFVVQPQHQRDPGRSLLALACVVTLKLTDGRYELEPTTKGVTLALAQRAAPFRRARLARGTAVVGRLLVRTPRAESCLLCRLLAVPPCGSSLSDRHQPSARVILPQCLDDKIRGEVFGVRGCETLRSQDPDCVRAKAH